MFYHYVFLPVDGPLEDGCWVMDSAGIPFIYNMVTHLGLNMENFKVCEPFLVEYVFNEMKVVGRVSPTVDWLGIGSNVKAVDCEKAYINPTLPPGLIKFYDKPVGDGLASAEVWRVRCPTCKKLH